MSSPMRAVPATPTDLNLLPMDERATPPPATPAIPQVTHEELRAGAERRTTPINPRDSVQGDGIFPHEGRSAPENTRRAPRSTRLTPEQQAKADLLKTAVERVLDQHRNRAGCLKRLFIYLFGRIAYRGEIKKQKGVEGKSLETLQAAAKHLAQKEASRRFPSKEELATAPTQQLYARRSDRAIHAEHLDIEEANRLFRKAFEQRVQVLQLDLNQHHCEVAFALVETAFKAQRTVVANGRINPTHKPIFIDKVLQNHVDTFAQQSLFEIVEGCFDFVESLTKRFPDSFSTENTSENRLYEAIRKAHPNVTEYDDAITTLRKFQADPNYLPQRVRAELHSIREELIARRDATQEELRAAETTLARLREETNRDPRTIEKGEENLARLRQGIEASLTEIRAHDARIDEEKEKGKKSLLQQINILTHLRDQIAPPTREPAPNNTTSHRHRGVPPSINASHGRGRDLPRRERAPSPSPSVLPPPAPPLAAPNQPLRDPNDVDISLRPRWVRLEDGRDLMFFLADDGRRVIVSNEGKLLYDTPDERGNWIETGLAAPDPRFRQQIVPTPEDIRTALDSVQPGEVVEGPLEVIHREELKPNSPDGRPVSPPRRRSPSPALLVGTPTQLDRGIVSADQVQPHPSLPSSRCSTIGATPPPSPIPAREEVPLANGTPVQQMLPWARLPDGKWYLTVHSNGVFYAKNSQDKVFFGAWDGQGDLVLNEEIPSDQPVNPQILQLLNARRSIV